MISPAIRSKIKKELGDHVRYSAAVRRLLIARHLTNSKGKPYSKQDIVNVFNGLRNNPDIEIAILDWFEAALQRRQEQLERLKEIQKTYSQFS